MKRIQPDGERVLPPKTREQRIRSRPPTVRELESLDTSQSELHFGAVHIPIELSCLILGFVVRSQSQENMGSALRDVIQLQQVSKSMRRASHALMRHSSPDEDWKVKGVLWDANILRCLHALTTEQSNELIQYRWNLSPEAARGAAADGAKSKGARLKMLPEHPEKYGDEWLLERFDSTGFEVESWLGKSGALRRLRIMDYIDDPQNLLPRLAPQLESLHVCAITAASAVNFGATMQALQTKTFAALRWPAITVTPDIVQHLVTTLTRFESLRSISLTLLSRAENIDTQCLDPLFKALQSMQKLSGMRLSFLGNGFGTLHEHALAQACTQLAQQRSTLLTLKLLIRNKRVECPALERALAENQCYAPRNA